MKFLQTTNGYLVVLIISFALVLVLAITCYFLISVTTKAVVIVFIPLVITIVWVYAFLPGIEKNTQLGRLLVFEKMFIGTALFFIVGLICLVVGLQCHELGKKSRQTKTSVRIEQKFLFSQKFY